MAARPYPYGFCVFDIDGTLVPIGAKAPSARVIETLRELRRRGAAVIVATGRPPAIAFPVIAQLGRHVDFLITCNGASAAKVAQPHCPAELDPSKWETAAPATTLDIRTLDRCIPKLLEAVPGAGIMACFEDAPGTPLAKSTAMTESIVPYFVAMAKRMPSIKAMAPSAETPKLEMPHQAHGGRAVLSVWVRHSDISQQELLKKAAPIFSEAGLAFEPAGIPTLCAVTNPATGKETPVVHILQETLSSSRAQQVGADDCIAFGDGLNDISLLKWAGIGVAMGKAESEDVTAAADCVTGSAEDEGVPTFVDQLLSSASSVREYRQSTGGESDSSGVEVHCGILAAVVAAAAAAAVTGLAIAKWWWPRK